MFSLIYFLALGCYAQSVDPAIELAELLQKKGILNSEELHQVQGLKPDQRIERVIQLLTQKGVLGGAELTGKAVGNNNKGTAVPPPRSEAKQAPKSGGEWRNGAGGLTTTFHGALMLNSFANLSNMNIQDVPLFQNKGNLDALGNDKSFGMTLRQSRIGLTLQGQGIGDSKLLAVIEGDFFGGKAALPPGEHMAIPRLRLAYLRLNGKRNSVVVGQDWSVFAPLNPVSYAAYSIPAYAGGGNPWIRLPQLRYERRQPTAGDGDFTWQFAITDPNLGDHPLGTFLTARTPGVGERGQMPGLENRFQFAHPWQARTLAIGISGRYGRGLNTGLVNGRSLQQVVNSWGVSVDYSWPVINRFMLVGEVYTGRALGGYSSSIAQAVLTPGGPGGGGVYSRGGWAQLQYQFRPDFSVNLAYGADAMRARDLRSGDRIFNGGPMVNAIYKIAPNWSAALEWRRLATRWHRTVGADEAGEQVNLSVLWLF